MTGMAIAGLTALAMAAAPLRLDVPTATVAPSAVALRAQAPQGETNVAMVVGVASGAALVAFIVGMLVGRELVQPRKGFEGE
jgi:hypothetical protein